ncbi:Ppx/GppA phosphatase family protein [Psittacicella hinzii]|uniref:Exopolyphosphatase n=1 Tax=Psittacicella hinzii TaxID=2028575 RepID=A0A3A1YI77_9GAMM|nr:Ppx/GppA phosphatase family protein [Psittacicella hinzii]RIY37963.1 hypothetical protein CKF58_04335 [Psittacicella hinzii]
MFHHKKSPKYIAIIDLGSNSFNLIIARNFGLSRPVIKRFNITVQLARYLTADNILLPEGIERCCNALAAIQEFISHFGNDIEVRANATYTIRSTKNQEELLTAINKVFPHKIKILTGIEEANTIFKGIALSNPITQPFIAVDIGGGSTEMILSNNLEPEYLTSNNLGCVSFSQKFFSDGKFNAELFNQAYKAACQIFTKELDNPIVHKYLNIAHAVGSSGTIKNTILTVKSNFKDAAKRINHLLAHPEPENPLYDAKLLSSLQQQIKEFADKFGNPEHLTAQNLEYLVQMVLQHNSCAQLCYTGFDPSGREVLAGGLSILRALFNVFKFQKLTYSHSALREGVLFGDQESDIFKHIRLFTVHNLRRKYQIEHKLFNSFYQQALSLVQQDKLLFETYNKQDIANYCTFMLVGSAISDDDFFAHSGYIVKNSNLYGFSDAEIAKIHQFIDCLNNDCAQADQATQQLAVLLRITYNFTFSNLPKLIKQGKVKLAFTYQDNHIETINLYLLDEQVQNAPYIITNVKRLNKMLEKQSIQINVLNG